MVTGVCVEEVPHIYKHQKKASAGTHCSPPFIAEQFLEYVLAHKFAARRFG